MKSADLRFQEKEHYCFMCLLWSSNELLILLLLGVSLTPEECCFLSEQSWSFSLLFFFSRPLLSPLSPLNSPSLLCSQPHTHIFSHLFSCFFFTSSPLQCCFPLSLSFSLHPVFFSLQWFLFKSPLSSLPSSQIISLPFHFSPSLSFLFSCLCL